LMTERKARSRMTPEHHSIFSPIEFIYIK